MIKVIRAKRFKKDVKRIKKQGKSISLVEEIVNLILENKTLDAKYKDHKLKGEYNNCRECHLTGDWLLIYMKNETKLLMMRTGSHSELFE